MSKTHEIIRVLILDESQNDAEKLISLLRNAGHATRAHRITSEEQLIKALKEQTWDLMLARPHAGECSAEQAITQIKRLEKDMPSILLIDSNDSAAITKGLAMGMRDVVPFDEDARLLLVIARELISLQDQRGRRLAEIALHEAEKRCSLLLDSSQNPIAYVIDGMHVYANETYMKMFGYNDADELAGMPLIDMIAPADQPKFKEFMKRYSNSEEKESEFSCGLIQVSGSTTNMRIKFSDAEYDGEACTQIVLHPDSAHADLEAKLHQLSNQDLLTGLDNRTAFLAHLDDAVEKALKQNQVSGLCYINLDAFTKTCAQIGIAEADTLLSEVGQLLKTIAPENCKLARLSDDIFTALLSNSDIDATLPFAEKIHDAIAHHLFDIAGITIQITCSISVLLINEATPAPQEIVSRAMRVSEILTRKGGNAVMQYQAEKDSSSKVTASPEESLIARIEDAINNDKFALRFQPIISLQGDPHEHYEALLSLPNENDSFMSAFEIFTAAQHIEGLCIKIDRWVIINAMKSLIEHRNSDHNTKLFINLTPAALQDAQLITWINDAFKEVALPPESVIFQFNEDVAVTYLKQVKTFTERLAALQIKVCIANFGCALNPMNALAHIAADYIKLDGSFALNMQKTTENSDILKKMLADLKEANKLTIVPLVENAAMLSALWQAGACFIQGHYVQAPSPQMNYDFSME